jgi:transposase InsO family protein
VDQGDLRAGPTKNPANTLSELETKTIIEVSNSPEYRDLSPWKIVPKLADFGRFIASESSFYRVLNKNKMLAHRQKSKPKQHAKPKHLFSTKPNQVWTWDITYLKTNVRGNFYYLYLIEDIFSRKIVGWAIHDVECANHSATLIDACILSEKVGPGQLHLHSDNGGPMKGSTMLVKLQDLGVVPSFSRPQVSDDNPFSESLFKTLKYCPLYPDVAFKTASAAQDWVSRFVNWYNTEHLHSGIKFVTPNSRHQGLDEEILSKRKKVYEAAKLKNPNRWSGKTRNWAYIPEVHLNQKKKVTMEEEMLRKEAS